MGQRKKEKKKGKKNKKSRILIFTFAKDLPCAKLTNFFFFSFENVCRTALGYIPPVYRLCTMSAAFQGG